jgi:hypothetical protein
MFHKYVSAAERAKFGKNRLRPAPAEYRHNDGRAPGVIGLPSSFTRNMFRIKALRLDRVDDHRRQVETLTIFRRHRGQDFD